MFMSPSHAIINVSLLRGALFPSHAFSFNIGNRQGRGVSRVQIGNKIVKYLSQDYHESSYRNIPSSEIPNFTPGARISSKCAPHHMKNGKPLKEYISITTLK